MKTNLHSKLIFAFLFTIGLSSIKLYGQSNKISVEIDYGNQNKVEKTVERENSMTALEALQLAATVETHAVKKHVFVTSINHIKAERGKTAWYYKVNGKSPKVLAINNKLKNGDVITWRFTKDVCSKTVGKTSSLNK